MVEGSITFGSPRFPRLESCQQRHGEEDEAVPAVDPLPPAPIFWHREQRGDTHTDPSACTGTPIRACRWSATCADMGRCMEKPHGVITRLSGHQETRLDAARISPVAHQAERRMRSFQQISWGFFQLSGGMAQQGYNSLLHFMKWLKPMSV